jgi:hypothetical protein
MYWFARFINRRHARLETHFLQPRAAPQARDADGMHLDPKPAHVSFQSEAQAKAMDSRNDRRAA